MIGQWCREAAAGLITDIYQDELWLQWTWTERALRGYSRGGAGGVGGGAGGAGGGGVGG